jgi:chemotaxis protein histidine kinase CheA
MKALGEKYANQFPDRTAEIKSLWVKVAGDPTDLEALNTLYRLVHGLAGSGATFGFPQLSEAARQCEHTLLGGIESGLLEFDEAKNQLDMVLSELEGKMPSG